MNPLRAADLRRLLAAILLSAAVLPALALAKTSDRDQPMTLDADASVCNQADANSRCVFNGNVVIVQHDSERKTLYAHLNKFAPKLSAGDKIERGQKIGEVGKTGWATGPHLHFEFLLNGEQVDPQLVIPPPPPPLDTAEQARFDQFRDAFLSSVSGVRIAGDTRFE